MTLRGSWLWIVAGVNGAGKTTLVKRLLPELPFINADEVAAELSPEDPQQAALTAGRAVLSKLQTVFGEGASVAWETTLSGRFHRRVIRSAKDHGYRIGALYIGLDSPQLAMGRVSDRVLKGGHHIPDADVERRFVRSLQNLPDLLAGVDYAFVFDNTASGARSYRRVIRARRGVVTRTTSWPPAWFGVAFGSTPVTVGMHFKS